MVRNETTIVAKKNSNGIRWLALCCVVCPNAVSVGYNLMKKEVRFPISFLVGAEHWK